MGYIYKITNSENSKIYIGATKFNINKRWREHKHDYTRFDRPIYLAMRELGFDKFDISVVEEVSNEVLNKREKFWIKQFNSKEEGYNFTYGGKGRKTIDDNLVIKEYNKLKNIKKVSEELNIDAGQVSTILKNHNIEIDLSESFRHLSKPIIMINKKSGYISEFKSISSAANFLIKKFNLENKRLPGLRGHIAEVCKNKRKSCQGYTF